MNADEQKASEEERKNAFIQLEKLSDHLIDLFMKSFKEKNRGALIIRTFSLDIEGHKFSPIDYNNRNDSLDMFDTEGGRNKLSELIDNYNPEAEGIIILITKSRATWFATFKFIPQTNKL